jgi:hypothetical protein
LIGRFLKTMTSATDRTREKANRIRKKAYRFFLQNGRIWKHPKKRNGVPLRVVVKKEEQEELLTAFHESPWAGHRGTWATFERLKDKYWWPGLYKDVHRFVRTRESCQMYSMVRHRDELHLIYPPTVHFKWMVDLMTMLLGVGQMRYLVLAREDLTNQVEGRALQNKTIASVVVKIFAHRSKLEKNGSCNSCTCI